MAQDLTTIWGVVVDLDTSKLARSSKLAWSSLNKRLTSAYEKE